MRLPTQLRAALRLSTAALLPAILASCGSDRVFSPPGGKAARDVNVNDPSVTFIIPPAVYNSRPLDEIPAPAGASQVQENWCNTLMSLQRVSTGQVITSWRL